MSPVALPLLARAPVLPHFSDASAWWPATKTAGLYLAPYLAAQEPAGTNGHRNGRRVFLPGDFESSRWGE